MAPRRLRDILGELLRWQPGPRGSFKRRPRANSIHRGFKNLERAGLADSHIL
jgi:hypothetical protein